MVSIFKAWALNFATTTAGRTTAMMYVHKDKATGPVKSAVNLD